MKRETRRCSPSGLWLSRIRTVFGMVYIICHRTMQLRARAPFWPALARRMFAWFSGFAPRRYFIQYKVCGGSMINPCKVTQHHLLIVAYDFYLKISTPGLIHTHQMTVPSEILGIPRILCVFSRNWGLL